MSDLPPETLQPLPVRVRPRPLETIDSFIGRLALANHIKPSHLHRIVSGPHFVTGRVAPDRNTFNRLAVLSDTSADILQRALTLPTTLALGRIPSPHLSGTENSQAQLFFEIQRDADGRGLAVRTLAERYKVSRRTVRQALDAPRTPPHQLRRRFSWSARPYGHLIAPLLEQGRTATEIWDHLIEEHGITLARSAIARYAQNWQLDQTRRARGHLTLYSYRPSTERQPPHHDIAMDYPTAAR